MTERETRHFELRLDGEGDGRTLIGLAVPYNEPADIVDWRGEYTEVFRPGSLAKTMAERGDKLRIYYQHQDRMLPVGISTGMVDTPRGPVVHARISETTMGNDILTLARDGALNSFSISFTTISDVWPQADFREVKEAKLHEISIVNEPAYAGARVTAIRAAAPITPDEQAEVDAAESDLADSDARAVPAALYAARARLWALRYAV